jgi:hypothetical protein
MPQTPPRPDLAKCDENDSEAEQSQPRISIARVSIAGSERLSGGCISLSPRAQRRMSLGRRTGF